MTRVSFYITPADVGDAGPIRRPDFVGLCSEHGWWFPARTAFEEWCPMPCCNATVFIYQHTTDFQPAGKAE